MFSIIFFMVVVMATGLVVAMEGSPVLDLFFFLGSCMRKSRLVRIIECYLCSSDCFGQCCQPSWCLDEFPVVCYWN